MKFIMRSILCYTAASSLLFNTGVEAKIHDPTKPIAEVLSATSKQNKTVFNLQSIMIGPMRILAMINGQLVGTGSTIQGARVLAIGKNHVVLLYAGQKQTIYLFGRRLWKAN